MGVYIPNIKPEQFYELCKQKGIEIIAVPVPKHGRLIDADNLCELCDIMADKCDGIGKSIWHQFRTTVEWTPTIIPAEEGETWT